MIVNLKYCIIRFYMFYFFKCSINISKSEYFTFKLVVKLLSALSVYTVFGLQVFLVISKINIEFLNPLYRNTLLIGNSFCEKKINFCLLPRPFSHLVEVNTLEY